MRSASQSSIPDDAKVFSLALSVKRSRFRFGILPVIGPAGAFEQKPTVLNFLPRLVSLSGLGRGSGWSSLRYFETLKVQETYR